LLLDRTDELLDLALDQISTEGVDALALLGDLTNSADDESFATVQGAVAQMGCLVLAVPGNHDINEPGTLSRFGDRSRGAEIEVAPAVVDETPDAAIILVAIERDGATNALHSAGFPDLAPYRGKTLLVFSHYPLLAMQSRLHDAGLKHAGDLADRQDIAEQLLQHVGPVIVVHGHLHVRAAEVRENMLHLSCAALVEPPHEVSVVAIEWRDRGSPVVRFEATRIMTSSADRLPVLDPADKEWQYEDGGWKASV
jgi:predicted phosphodiesterase